MLEILKYLRKREVALIFTSAALVLLQVVLELKLPDYMKEITVLVQTPGNTLKDVWIAGGYMMLCALASMILAIATGYLSAIVAASFSKRLRSGVYDRVTAFSMEEINNFSTASLITRSTNDIVQVQMVIAMGMVVIFRAPFMATWAILKIADKNISWMVVTGIAVAVMLGMLSVLIIFALPRFRIIQTLTDNLNRVTRENLTGIRVVRAYNAEKFQQEKFEGANEDLTQTHLFVSRIMAIMGPGMAMIMSGLSLAIYWIGAYLIQDAAGMDRVVVFSDMIVFVSYAMQIVMSFMMLTMIFIIVPRAAVSAKRILEVLKTQEKVVDGTKGDSATDVQGEIEFRNVCFQYPDAGEPVLQDISFIAKKGETVAFIGSTGSGKSTLINLIPRFFDATAGEVLVDGINVRTYTQEALRNKIGYVSQRAVLFGGTIASNVAFGSNAENKDYSPEEIRRALRIAQAEEFVDEMDGREQAAVSQGGTNLSGGQKQRISIARAICRKPEILIFDDSFSALDYKTDRILREELSKETAQTTKLIVAQRIGTIMDADKIIVLDEGRMVGCATHRELLRDCEVYRQIAYSQLSKEELDNE